MIIRRSEKQIQKVRIRYIRYCLFIKWVCFARWRLRSWRLFQKQMTIHRTRSTMPNSVFSLSAESSLGSLMNGFGMTLAWRNLLQDSTLCGHRSGRLSLYSVLLLCRFLGNQESTWTTKRLWFIAMMPFGLHTSWSTAILLALISRGFESTWVF